MTLFQINADAVQNGLTVVPAARNINGISLSSVVTPIGVVYLYLGEYLPAGTALLLNLSVLAPVFQPVPGKGNFFLEALAKTGAGEKYQLFGQIGLDHGPESVSYTHLDVYKRQYLNTPNEYLYYDVFPEARLVQTNADNKTINLKSKSRFPTIMCRSIDARQVGLSEATNVLYLDDCVEGREEAKNRQRLDDKWEVISGDIMGRAIEGTPRAEPQENRGRSSGRFLPLVENEIHSDSNRKGCSENEQGVHQDHSEKAPQL